MHKLIRPLLLLPLLLSALPGRPADPEVIHSEKRLTLEDIFLNRAYAVEDFEVDAWVEGGAAFLTGAFTDSGRVILRYDAVTGEQLTFISGPILQWPDQDQIEEDFDFQISPDERYLLLPVNERCIWRRSREAAYYLHDLQTGTTRRLAEADAPQSNGTFSPDSRKVAYVMDHNIYAYDIDKGRTRQLTKDGSKDIINGQADWLYEEEFSLTRTYEWSPDSRFILYLRFDQGHIRSYPLKDELTQYPMMTWVRYPKVGERNSLVQVGVADVKRGRTRWLDVGPEKDIYIPRICWTSKEGQAAFYRLDRRQQRLELVLADARTGKTTVTAVQTDSAWVDVTDDLNFIEAGRRFIWTTEESGYRHIYLHDVETGQARALTSGDWEVTEVLAVDEEGQAVYFSGKKDGVVEQQVYRVGFDGGDLARLTEPGGWNSCEFSPDFAHYVQLRSSINVPMQVSLHQAGGELVQRLVEEPSALKELDLPAWELFTLTTTDGAELAAKILKPADFDPRRKCPTLIYTYGGPGSQKVIDKWGESRGRDLWHRYLAQNGYVVLTVDNRGTGGRGKAFKNLVYGDIGKWARHDQVEAAKWISRQGWGDPERVAIWGWSGGGSLTALCLTASSEYFKCGIAVAPVTDSRLYDTAWTERYMELLPENKAGYESADVLSHIDGYEGGLLIVHGTGDDNVHPQHTWQFIDKVTAKNKPLDVMMYPGKNHDLPGVHYHLYSKMTRFLKENL